MNAAPVRILVVDDDTPFRTRLVRALVARGFNAIDAGDPPTALALARTQQPQRAVVDLKMPGGGGLDLIRDLVDAVPGIQVLVLTGYGSIPTAVEAVRRGAIDYLSKPADADQVLAAFDKSHDDDEPAAATPSLARVEWEHIQRILFDTNNNISEAARRLGIHRRSLQRKLAKMPPFD